MSDLTPAIVAAQSAISFSNAGDINRHFAPSGFIAWFNGHVAGKGPFAGKAMNGAPAATLELNFEVFWNAIPVIYGRASVTAIEFASLVAIAINETGGNFGASPELCGRGAVDAAGVRHAGLAYPFDQFTFAATATRPASGKASYNKLSGNLTALSLFADAHYSAAHGALAKPAGFNSADPAWGGKLYPAAMPTTEDPAINGFVMQADFYKFRGRGPVQCTGRAIYTKIVSFIQAYAGADPTIAASSARWRGLTADQAATVSRDDEWDQLFDRPEVTITSVSADNAGVPYLTLSADPGILNDNGTVGTFGKLGSIYRVGRVVSGSSGYARNIYRPRVIALVTEFP